MPIVRNKKTGEYLVVDETGSPVEGAKVVRSKSTGTMLPVDSSGDLLLEGGIGGGPTSASSAKVDNGYTGQYGAQDPSSTITSNTTWDKIKAFNNDYIRPILPVAGQLAAGAATEGMSIPAQMAAGAGGYFAAKQGLDMARGNRISSVFDATDSPLVNNILEAGGNELLNRGISGVPKAGSKLLKNYLGKIPQDASIAGDRAVMASEIGGVNSQGVDTSKYFPRSVGQATGNKYLQGLESRYGGKAASDLAEAQKNVQQGEIGRITNLFFPNGVPSDVNATTQKKMVEHYFDSGEKVDKLFNDFRKNHLESNIFSAQREVANPNFVPNASFTRDESGNLVKDVNNTPTKLEDVHLKGPIFLTKTSQLANQMKPQVDAFMSSQTFENLPAPVKSKFATLQDAINNFTQDQKLQSGGHQFNVPIKEFEATKNWRTAINSLTSQDQKLNLPKGSLVALKTALGNDIEDSVGNFWNNSKQAIKDLSEANTAHGDFQDTFDKGMKSKLFKGAPQLSRQGDNLADPSNIYSQIGSSPQKAREFMTALGSKNQDIAKGSIFSKLMESSMNDATGEFSPDKVINAIKAPGYKEIFSNSERSDLENAMRSLRTMDPSTLSGTRGMNYKASMFHLALPLISAASGAVSGYPLVGAATGATTQAFISIAPRQFVQRILLNPKYSRIAAQLPFKQASAPGTSALTQTIFKGLGVGTQVILNENGTQTPATIQQDGSVKPN